MKKTMCGILISAFLFSLVSCDKTHLCSLDVLCSNENASIVVNGEAFDSFNFSNEGFNHQPKENYSSIDFTNTESNVSNANVNKFEIASLTDDTYSLSLKLVDVNNFPSADD